MGEGQRIEGQMFRASGVWWAVAIVLLIVSAGAVMILGYAINQWSAAVGNMTATMAGGAGGAGGGGGLGAAGMIVIPTAAAAVPVSKVPWVVPASGTVREHWEKQQQGIGTWFAGYWTNPQRPGMQFQSSQAISIPVEGEDRFVLVLHVPIGQSPANATSGQLWVSEMTVSGPGQYSPSYTSGTVVMAQLDEKKLKWLWEKGLPRGLAKAMFTEGYATVGPAGGTVAYWGVSQKEVDIEKYFVEAPATDEAKAEEEQEKDGE